MKPRTLSAARDLMLVVGLGLIALGAGLVFRPAGVIVLGLELVAAAVLSALDAPRKPADEPGRDDRP